MIERILKQEHINNMRTLVFALCVMLTSCKSELWTSTHEIEIEGISATGIVPDGDNLWLSDTDENRLVQIDINGKILKKIDGFERPMHISKHGDEVLVPEYLNDTVRIVSSDGISGYLELPDSPDAPASVDMLGENILVADFYNHRVIYKKDGKDMSFGKKGSDPKEFHYPTDVQFAHDKIYVADAYNHRVQVFDADANHLMTFGEEEQMNATTGLYVSDKYVLATDFENDRLLTYSLDGKLLDIIEEGFHRPTDALIDGDKMYVLNYKGQFISVFE